MAPPYHITKIAVRAVARIQSGWSYAALEEQHCKTTSWGEGVSGSEGDGKEERGVVGKAKGVIHKMVFHLYLFCPFSEVKCRAAQQDQ